MKNSITIKSFVIVTFLLILSLINSISITAYEPSKIRLIYVNDNNISGPWDGTQEHPYQHIKDGISNASDGDFIYVLSGEYYENIVIDKTITLFGENRSNTIIDGMYGKLIIHTIQDGIIIEGFTIRNSGGFIENAGIKLDSNYNIIRNCTIYRTKTGIYGNNTENNEIKNCTFHTNGEGIYLRSSNEDKISSCYFYHNAFGINIESSNVIIINDCYTDTNSIGYFLNNSSNINMLKCAVYNNNDNGGGLFFSKCYNINITNSIISHNGFGVKISDCLNVTISASNFFWNTHSAIFIKKDSRDNEIKNCEITENFRFGIYLENSKCNLVKNNIYNSIFNIYSEYSVCDARNNWWGFPLGPTFSEHVKNCKISFKYSNINFFPWSFIKIKNTGSSWKIDYNRYNIKINNSRYEKIALPGIDSDNDYIPNWWEEKWGYDPFTWNNHENLDTDGDGLNNIEECYTDEWNSNPFYKDVFLEIDWVETKNSNNSNKPCKNYLSKMVSAFKTNNINLHLDEGTLGGGEEIPTITNFTYADLRELYWNYFLHNDLNNPRKGIFHYCIVCDYGPGRGFAFIGWDHLDSFLISAQMIQNSYSYYSRGRIIIGGAFHELGHTLGLFVDDHGGIDNKVATWPITLQWWKFQNYKSCMNYRYTYRIIDYSDGDHGKGDYDDWSNLDFKFFKNTHFEWPKY